MLLREASVLPIFDKGTGAKPWRLGKAPTQLNVTWSELFIVDLDSCALTHASWFSVSTSHCFLSDMSVGDPSQNRPSLDPTVGPTVVFQDIETRR